MRENQETLYLITFLESEVPKVKTVDLESSRFRINSWIKHETRYDVVSIVDSVCTLRRLLNLSVVYSSFFTSERPFLLSNLFSTHKSTARESVLSHSWSMRFRRLYFPNTQIFKFEISTTRTQNLCKEQKM